MEDPLAGTGPDSVIWAEVSGLHASANFYNLFLV